MKPVDYSKEELKELMQAEEFDFFKTYTVAKDLRTGAIDLTPRKSASKHYKVLGKVKPIDVLVETFQRIANQKRDLICYTTLKKEYGEENAKSIQPLLEVDNPYYKCAVPMRLYDREVVEHIITRK